MRRESVVGTIVGAVLGVILAAAVLTAYNSTASSLDELAGRGTLTSALITGAFLGGVIGAILTIRGDW